MNVFYEAIYDITVGARYIKISVDPPHHPTLIRVVIGDEDWKLGEFTEVWGLLEPNNYDNVLFTTG